MEEDKKKGKICVTGGTGFLGSWMVKKLLQQGYSVNATIRFDPTGSKKDISYLTTLPGASERLQIFNADLNEPDSFSTAISGCIGLFHVAHPMYFQNKDNTEKSVRGILRILQACLNSKTVKRVVYTSSAATVFVNGKRDLDQVLDESSWSDVDCMRKLDHFATYSISKTLTEKAALEFGEKHCLDVVSVIPTWIHGPFITPTLPGSVSSSLAMIIGNRKQHKYHEITPFVHVDDVANAHIFLFKYPKAKGRYICSAIEIKVEELFELVSKKYPEYQILNPDSLTDRSAKFASLSSKKLLDTGFKYKYGLEEMFDGAIECCKQKGFL